jgi:hypothetical protein
VTTDAENGISPELLERLEAAAAGASDCHSIAERLKVTDEERPSAPGHLQAAFEYAEAAPRPEPVGVGSFFGPMMEFGDQRYPPALEALTKEMAATWQAAANLVTAPLAAARLNDLCFEAGRGDRGSRARKAIETYLAAARELASGSGEESDNRRPYTRLSALSRARQLARAVGDEGLEQQAVAEIMQAAKSFVTNDPREAVLFLGLLVNDARPAADVNALLDKARERLVGDAIGREEALRTQLRLSCVDDATRQQLRRELVTAIAAQADAMEGIAQVHHLERAISEARDGGLQEMVDELTLRMQALSASGDLEMAAQEFGFTIQRDQIERWLNIYLSAPDWQQALLRLAAAPPSGNVEKNRLEAEAQAKAHPLQWLFTRVVVGGDGLPRFTPSNDEELRNYQLTTYEMQKAQLQAVFLPELFTRIWKKWGPLTLDDLMAFFAASTHVDEELARALARDLRRLFTGDHEGALYTGAAHVETLARRLVLACAQPAYRTQRANAPGQYIGLGALFLALQVAGLDESWTRFLHGLLSSPMGLNYRNELLHGFELETSETTAALLFVGIVYLARGVGLGAPERGGS